MVGGRAVKLPIVEKIAVLDLTNMVIELNLEAALAKDFIPLNVSGAANLKIDSVDPGLERALQRLLGVPRDTLVEHVSRILNAVARGLVSQYTANYAGAYAI